MCRDGVCGFPGREHARAWVPIEDITLQPAWDVTRLLPLRVTAEDLTSVSTAALQITRNYEALH